MVRDAVVQNRRYGARRGRGERTILEHRRNIEHKIKANNTADLTRWFFQKKYRVSFGLSPRTVRHIATLLLLLISFGEIAMLPFIRINSSRPAQQQMPLRLRSSRVRKNEYTF